MRKINFLLFPLAVFLLILYPQVECSQGKLASISCADQTKAIRQIVRFKPNELKKRAVRKVDIDPGVMARLDFSSTIVLELVTAPDGSVVCTRALSGFAPASAEVGKAVRQWRFAPFNIDGKPVATTGTLEFSLCNISCGQDMSMSILQ